MLLDDCIYRQNMYMLASQHYASLNMMAFTTPSIIITSVASFLSFAGATDPVNSKNIGLTVLTQIFSGVQQNLFFFSFLSISPSIFTLIKVIP